MTPYIGANQTTDRQIRHYNKVLTILAKVLIVVRIMLAYAL